jgi:hypothetical protein
MGTGRIRHSKRRKKDTEHEAHDAGILDDLEDQAAWSSYGQQIPRLGNPHRDAIWWRRRFRTIHNWGRLPGNPVLRSRSMWMAVGLGVLTLAAFIAVIAALAALFHAMP